MSVTVPLAPKAVEVLKATRPRRKKGAKWAFPSAGGDEPVRHPQGIAERLKAATGIRDAVLHGLRRTAATRLREQGTPREVVDAILGHVPPGLVGVYQLYQPLKEMRAALTRWAKWLVVPLVEKKKGAAN